MQVTDVRVRRVEKEGKMKAIVSITLDNEFVIHDIKVIEKRLHKRRTTGDNRHNHVITLNKR